MLFQNMLFYMKRHPLFSNKYFFFKLESSVPHRKRVAINHIDGRQPKPRISIFFKNTFISVFGRKYYSTQSVKKL